MKSLMPGMLLATLFCVAGCRGPYNGSWFGRVGAWREPDAAQRDEDRQIADRDGADEDQWDSERDLSAGHAAEQAALTARQSGSTANWQQLLTEAQRNYSRVLEAPSNVYQGTAHHRLGVIADQQEDFASAEQHYVAALRLKPGDADLLSDLGYSYLSQGELTQSESYLRQALSVSPSHRQALLNLGLLRGRSGDRAGALALFRQAGTEAEAQSMLNQLFPQGASVAGNATLGAPKTPPGSAVPSVATSGTPYQQGQRNNAFAQQSASPESRRTPAQMQQEVANVARGRQPTHSFSADAMHANERGTPPQTANGWGNPHPGSFTGEPSPAGSARMNANTVAGMTSERPLIVPAGGDMQHPLTGGTIGRAAISGPTRTANGPQNNFPQDHSRPAREPIDTMQPWPPETRMDSPQHPLVADPRVNRGKTPAVDETARRAALLGMNAGPGQMFPQSVPQAVPGPPAHGQRGFGHPGETRGSNGGQPSPIRQVGSGQQQANTSHVSATLPRSTTPAAPHRGALNNVSHADFSPQGFRNPNLPPRNQPQQRQDFSGFPENRAATARAQPWPRQPQSANPATVNGNQPAPGSVGTIQTVNHSQHQAPHRTVGFGQTPNGAPPQGEFGAAGVPNDVIGNFEREFNQATEGYEAYQTTPSPASQQDPSRTWPTPAARSAAGWNQPAPWNQRPRQTSGSTSFGYSSDGDSSRTFER